MVANKNKNKNNSKPYAVSVDLVSRKLFGLRTAHHHHTGKHVPTHYTSYAFLFFILVFTGLTLLLARILVQADPTQSSHGSVTLYGVVVGSPPNTPANIVTPKNAEHFNNNVINVSGTCQANALIEIYRSDIFAGSDMCSSDGEFSLSVTILPGENVIVARTKDSTGQYGPNSNIVTVFYDISDNPVPPVRSPQNPSAPVPLLLRTASMYTATANQNMAIKFEIDGGVYPYAVAVDWADNSQNTLLSLQKSGDYSVNHIYKDAGQFMITLAVTDVDGRSSLVQTVVIVNQINTSTDLVSQNDNCNNMQCFISERLIRVIDIMWVPFSIAGLMTISFWLGEKIILTRLRFTKVRL